MISCPPERELLELVDGELAAERADAVGEHLALCADCRVLLGASEAALRFATGGLADSGRWTPGPASMPTPVPTPVPVRRLRWKRLVAAAVVLIAVGGVWALPPSATAPKSKSASTVASATPTAPDAEIAALTARIDRLHARAQSATLRPRELLATGALAAAEARSITAGTGARDARLRDVIERFDGTVAAREARALLAARGSR